MSTVPTTQPAASPAAGGKAPIRVLFIGNSQMMVCELPRMIKALAESAPADFPRIEIGQSLGGGMTLKRHWDMGDKRGTPRGMIAQGKWDYVVIQEIYRATRQDFEPYAALFDEAINKAGAKTILFASASVTKLYPPANSHSYPESTKALNDMQIKFGRKMNVTVAAAGYAWMKYLGPNPTEQQVLDLYAKDGGHPGQKGSYIYACLLYATITGKNPVGLTSEFKDIRGGIAIDKDQAAKMQAAAWEQYQESGK